MRSGTTLVLTVAAGAVILLASPILALEAYELWSGYRFRQQSPIAAGAIGPSYVELEQSFRRRVQSAFPIGTSVSNMTDVLAKQGFKARSGQLRSGPAMVLDRGDIVCEEFWEVFWTASADTLTDVDADLVPRCL